MKRILLATLLAASGSVSATPFYLDIGTNFHAVGADKECLTCTSLKDQFTYSYESESTITDTNADGVLSTGDSITTNAGYDGAGGFFGSPGSINTNLINGFLPNQVGPSESNNGYGNDWIVTFGITNWTGTVTVDPVTNAVFPNYGAGVLEFYVSTDFVNYSNFMDINLSTGFVTGTGSVILGEVDFTNVTLSSFNNLFNVADPGQCGGLNGFYDIWNTCGPSGLDSLAIDFIGAFDSDVTISSFTDNLDGTYFVATDHDGSGRFAIPEPGTLSLLGLSLLGLGGLRMRKAADKKIAA